VKRTAFTMIELIFAIIIISIVVISMPMMMKTNQEAMEANVVQEALFASSAKMMQVLSLPWDMNSTDSDTNATYGKVVDITGTTNDYNRSDANGTYDVNSSYRVGHILQNNHRRFHDAQSGIPDTVSSLNTVSNPNPTALNNVYQTNINFSNPAATAVGYKNNYTMDVNVSYIADTGSPFVFAASGNNTPKNMKLITVNINKTNSDGTTTLLTSLRSYSANIGEFDFAKRRF